MDSHWRMFERIDGSSHKWHFPRNRQSHMTTTVASPADRLRAALKQAGFNARRVSVRADHSTLRVTIRDASASLTQVKAIAGPFETVRRCEASGDILMGGNRYVDVEYDDAVVKPLKAEFAALLAAAPVDEYV